MERLLIFSLTKENLINNNANEIKYKNASK